MLISEFANVHLHFLSFLVCGTKLWKETVHKEHGFVNWGSAYPTDCLLEVKVKLRIVSHTSEFSQGKKSSVTILSWYIMCEMK